MQNLKVLTLYKNEINKINVDGLNGLDSLQILDLSHAYHLSDNILLTISNLSASLTDLNISYSTILSSSTDGSTANGTSYLLLLTNCRKLN